MWLLFFSKFVALFLVPFYKSKWRRPIIYNTILQNPHDHYGFSHDHSANSHEHYANPKYIYVLWSNLQPHAGSNHLLHLFFAECHKDPTYSWWLQRPLVNSLGYHILTALDCSQGVHNDSWLKKACSSLNVRLSQSCLLGLYFGHNSGTPFETWSQLPSGNCW